MRKGKNDGRIENKAHLPGTILVVGDDTTLSGPIQKKLRRAGFQTEGALQGAEAIARIADRPPALLLLDYRLPDMTAKQVIETVSEQQCSVPFVVITDRGDEQAVVKMMKLGARHYLVKGTGFLDLLLPVVEQVVEQLATEKKLAEAKAELWQSQERYRQAVENSPNPIFSVNRDGIIQTWNRASEDVFQYGQEIVGRAYQKLLRNPEEYAAMETILAQIFQGHSLNDLEIYYKCKDGTDRFMLSRLYPLFDHDGDVQECVFANTDVGERMQTEEKLRGNEERYRQLVELSPDAIGIQSERKIVFMNPAGVKLFGAERLDQLVGKPIWDFVLPEYREIVAKRFQQMMKAGRAVSLIEQKFIRLDGIYVDAEVTATPFTYKGKPAIQAIFRDITERKQAEEKIRRRNRELALLNQVIAASAAGLEAESILETACRELALVFDTPQTTATVLNEKNTAAEVVAEYRAEGQPTALHQTIPLAGNAFFDYLLSRKGPLVVSDVPSDPRLAPIHDLLRQRGAVSLLGLPLLIEGEVVGSLNLETIQPRQFSAEEVSLAWSVADQVAGALARARLNQAHRRLSTAIEQVAEGVVITDTEGTILYVNPAFERLTGYSRAEAVGQNPRILKSGKQEVVFYQELWATISAGQVWQGRFVDKKKDGTLFTDETTISPIRSRSGAIVNYVAVKRDVTRELELEEQYRQAQKMEAVGQLTAGIAHDFNNLLTAINGYAELLQFELAPDDPRRKMVSNILGSGERAAGLVRQLLAFSRKQIIAPRVLNLNITVVEMDKILRRTIGENVELELILAPDLWSIKADPTQMEQVIVNLAVNARDAMPGGGKLTIETANVTLDEDDASQHLGLAVGDYVMLSVSDIGVGISQETQPHIFEPFFTTKEAGQGTGMGLATVFGIVKQNSGHIWVDSEPGQGATFRTYLPRVAEPTAPSPQFDRLNDLPQRTETVLLVEDEPALRELTARVLRRQGYTVLEAANGREALGLAQDYRSKEIHLLLTDVVMPRMGGEELANRLLATHSGIKVLFTSGYPDSHIAHRGLLAPDIMFIEKPFSPSALIHKVQEVLDK